MTDATTTALVPDPELIGPVLDLSRPELSQVMDRYRTPEAMPVRGPVALIVERPGLPSQRIKEAFRQEGWQVEACNGPGGSPCPLMLGEPCGLREGADIALVYVDKRAPSAATNTLPRLRCASHPASPSIVAIEGSIQSPAFTDHAATVGGLRDPRTILDVVKRLVFARKG